MNGSEYGLEISASFHFYGPEKVINPLNASVALI